MCSQIDYFFRGKYLRKSLVALGLFSCVISSSALAGAKVNQSFDFYQGSNAGSLEGIFLAQAQVDTSTNQTTSEDELAEEIDAEFQEELLAKFLADPAGFIADPDNAGIVEAVVRQAIARNPSNIDVVIAAVQGLSDAVILAAVADGIVRAAADYAAAGDTVASSQILANVSIATSSALRQAVQTKTSEITTGVAGIAETLSTPDNGAPTLATASAPTGDGDLGSGNTTPPAADTTQQSPTGDGDLGSGNTTPPAADATQQSPTNLQPIVTPPPIDSPASPA